MPEITFEDGDFRNDYFRDDRKQEVYERVRAIVSELGVTEDEMAEVALRYVVSPCGLAPCRRSPGRGV